MRIRKFVALVGAVTIFFGCIFFYRLTDHTLYLQDDASQHFESKMGPQVGVNKFKRDFRRNSAQSETKAPEPVFARVPHPNASAKQSSSNCKTITSYASAEIRMMEVYKELKFDNVDGGAWKQGWNIQVSPKRWNRHNRLKVFVVPHSHNDPGWVKTFEDYYTSETRNILNNLLKKMSGDARKRFIWAEISFLSLWWDELSQEDQEKVKLLVREKQLEIVTGGWVMNDEANSHYYSIITQLTEGHQWMQANFDSTPKNAWTIDPFGESPVMAYIFKKMGIENLVIQRVHYSVKKFLAKTRNLEFRWKQFWDEDGESSLFTHMMPFYSYDVPHTCGPDPKICCQFDFMRLPGNGITCPWKESPKPIHKKNVATRALMLLDQYRKKAELYRTNVLLVPLGDDFRYQLPMEWESQFQNYYRIMDYLNSNSSLFVDIQFGTLDEFFAALAEENPPEDFPTLTGDFFTYADRDDHYWSGYYTSRPFYKKMDRVLIGYHRAAEIMYALAWSYRNAPSTDWLLSPQTGFAKMLRDARRSLSLFQHHDGVTGTARDNVMEDYARKMLEAINNSQHVIQQCVNFLLSPSDEPFKIDPEEVYFDFDDHRRHVHSLPERRVLIFREKETKRLVFLNPYPTRRKQVVSVHVFVPYVQVLDENDNEVTCQTSPVFSQGSVMDESRYEVFFVVDVPAMGLASYTMIAHADWKNIMANKLSKVQVFNSLSPLRRSPGFEDVRVADGTEFFIENKYLKVIFSDVGLIRSYTRKESMLVMPLHLDFVRYLARPGKERSGAYLFLPEGEAVRVRVKSPLIRVHEGPVVSRAEVFLPDVKHTVTLFEGSDANDLGIEIENVVDIRAEKNYELAMRLTTQVKNGDEFYTDLNGFQMIKRRRFAKLPLQANYYPMPTAAYIEDEKSRVTLLSGQPLGASSLGEGQLEVMQDRRLEQDDNRGLGQGVLDNKPTPNLFRVLVERRIESCKYLPSSLSTSAFLARQNMLYPILKMMWKPEAPCELRASFKSVREELGHDVELLSARTMDEETKPSAGLVFLRHHVDSCFRDASPPPPSTGIVKMESFLPNHLTGGVKKTSLSFARQDDVLDRKKGEELCPMDFLSLLIYR